METHSIFATYVYSQSIEHNIDIETIARNLENDGLSKPIASNSGGWQSKKLVYESIEEMQPFLNNIILAAREIYKGYGISREPQYMEYWFNINRKYNFNWLHNHPNFYFSGVYYVKSSENSGDLVLERPDAASEWIVPESINIANCPAFKITPKVNNLLIFPSYLKHKVEQNLTDEDRISIAFNIK
jgi:uncharacterized protein (TIGR02466 family)